MSYSLLAVAFFACAVSGQHILISTEPAEAPSVPVSIHKYHAQDELGQASFGYSYPGQASSTFRDAEGNMVGSYSYVDSNGHTIQVSYVADSLGFRQVSNNLPIDLVGASVPAGTALLPGTVLIAEAKAEPAATTFVLSEVQQANSLMMMNEAPRTVFITEAQPAAVPAATTFVLSEVQPAAPALVPASTVMLNEAPQTILFAVEPQPAAAPVVPADTFLLQEAKAQPTISLVAAEAPQTVWIAAEAQAAAPAQAPQTILLSQAPQQTVLLTEAKAAAPALTPAGTVLLPEAQPAVFTLSANSIALQESQQTFILQGAQSAAQSSAILVSSEVKSAAPAVIPADTILLPEPQPAVFAISSNSVQLQEQPQQAFLLREVGSPNPAMFLMTEAKNPAPASATIMIEAQPAVAPAVVPVSTFQLPEASHAILVAEPQQPAVPSLTFRLQEAPAVPVVAQSPAARAFFLQEAQQPAAPAVLPAGTFILSEAPQQVQQQSSGVVPAGTFLLS